MPDALKAVDAAMGNLAPAVLSQGVGQAGFAVNRRENKEAEVPAIRAGGALKGPNDHEVPVLVVRDLEGKLKGVVFGYALRVAILPTITLIGLGFSGLLSGVVFAEVIFARPGVGKLIYDTVLSRNFPVVQGAIIVTTSLYLVITLASDLVVARLDPRVRESL